MTPARPASPLLDDRSDLEALADTVPSAEAEIDLALCKASFRKATEAGHAASQSLRGKARAEQTRRARMDRQ